jgi:hypothetical protein
MGQAQQEMDVQGRRKRNIDVIGRTLVTGKSDQQSENKNLT